MDDNEIKVVYEKYLKGLPSTGYSFENICRTFRRHRNSAEQYMYVRMVMRLRGLWPKHLTTKPNDPTGAELKVGVYFLEEDEKMKKLAKANKDETLMMLVKTIEDDDSGEDDGSDEGGKPDEGDKQDGDGETDAYVRPNEDETTDDSEESGEDEMLDEAFHEFTCCMVDAPCGTKEHALALFGRLRTLFRMGRYGECLDDVLRVFENSWGPPDDLLFDTLCTGGMALDMLGRGEEMTAFYKRAISIMDDNDVGDFPPPNTAQTFRDHFFEAIANRGTVKRPLAARHPPRYEEPHELLGARHKRYPAFSEFLEFKRTPNMGLGVFTTRDLEPGKHTLRRFPF